MMIKTARFLKPGGRVAAFGYPDMIAQPEQVESLLGEKYEELEYHKDSANICGRHSINPGRPIPDTYSFYKLLGCELDVYDVVQERGNEILCDLNHPFKAPHEYDMVLDPGTLEHCFNVGQAAFNMAGMVKKGGYIIHQNPFNCGNHGFYGLNPTWYADFYRENGFTLLDCRLCTSEKFWKYPETKRFWFTEEECGIFAMAVREEIKDFTFPTQTKYRKTNAQPAG